MISMRAKFAITAALAATALTAPALADDKVPTAEQRTAIERVLTEGGFTAWGKIDFDDGHWEVDDARHSDGKTYDLDLDRQSFAVLKQKLDD